MSCSGHHFSVHSPDCKAHMSIQSNRPIQVDAIAHSTSVTPLGSSSMQLNIDNNSQQQQQQQQQLGAPRAWGSTTPLERQMWSSPRSPQQPSGQSNASPAQILQVQAYQDSPATAATTTIRCNSGELVGGLHDNNDNDENNNYTLVILDCSPHPSFDNDNTSRVNSSQQTISERNLLGRAGANSTTTCESGGGCHCQTELIVRQQFEHDHACQFSSLTPARHQEHQQAQQHQYQQLYGSGSIADRSASQTSTRSQDTVSRQQQQQPQQPQLEQRAILGHRPQDQYVTDSRLGRLQQIQDLAPAQVQQQQQQAPPRMHQEYQVQDVNDNWTTAAFNSKKIITEHRKEEQEQQAQYHRPAPSAPSWQQLNEQQQQQASGEPRVARPGTRIVKRWHWNRAQFVEEEVPDKVASRVQQHDCDEPNPSSSSSTGGRRLVYGQMAAPQPQHLKPASDAWNQELHALSSELSPVPSRDQFDPSWLAYRQPDEQSVQADPLYRDLMLELQRLEEGVTVGDQQQQQRLQARSVEPSSVTTPDCQQRPVFGQPLLPESVELNECDNVEFIGRLIPNSDPTMRIEWTKNGRPLLESSRLTSEFEFGVVRICIRRCEAEDSGIYQCKALNALGEAVSRAKLIVHAKQSVQYETLHPAGLDKIRQLENPKQVQHVEEAGVQQAPKFLTHIQDYVERNEGDSVHFECCLGPVDDPDMRTEWFFNGRPLVTGSRFHTIDDFGFIVLDIDWLYPRDTGEYICRAINKWGSDFTRTVLRVRPAKNIILDSQLADNADATIDKLRQLEFPDVQDEIYVEAPGKPAHFVQALRSAANKRQFVEGDNVHFEARVGPASDGQLTVEWFHNDRPLISGHRFKPTFDFGHILLDILYVYPEDSGVYKCVARNELGVDVSEFEISVAGKPGLVYQSQLPKEMEGGVQKITDMEAMWNRAPDPEEDEEPAKRTAPEFVLEPKACTAFEGSCARFCCRILAHPRPRVAWFINDQLVVNGLRYKLTYDGMYHLIVPKCSLQDAGRVRVVAKNLLGECSSQTELQVKRKVDDYRGVLKNSPNPWYDEHTLKLYRRQKNQTDEDELNDSEDYEEFLANFQRQQAALVRHQQQQHQQQQQPLKDGQQSQLLHIATEYQTTSPLANQVIGYMEPGTPDVNLLATSRSPLVEPGDLHPVVLEQQVCMAPAPSTIQRALEDRDNGPATSSAGAAATPKAVPDIQKSFSNSTAAGAGAAAVGTQSQFTNDNSKSNNNNNDSSNTDLNSSGGGGAGTQQDQQHVFGLNSNTRRTAHQPWLSSQQQQQQQQQQASLSGNDQEAHLAKTTITTTSTTTTETKQQQQPAMRVTFGPPPASPENVEHGKEIHSHFHKQLQVERRANKEITREIIEKETFEQEHKGFSKDNLISLTTDESGFSSLERNLRATTPTKIYAPPSSSSGSLVDQRDQNLARAQQHQHQQQHLQQETTDRMIGQQQVRMQATSADTTAGVAGGAIRHQANLSNQQQQQQQIIIEDYMIPPEFVQKIQPCQAIDGDEARFECVFRGTPEPTITWYRDNKLIRASNLYSIETDLGQHKSTLVIKRVTLNGNALYTVKAENVAGSAKSSANLVVEPHPLPGVSLGGGQARQFDALDHLNGHQYAHLSDVRGFATSPSPTSLNQKISATSGAPSNHTQLQFGNSTLIDDPNNQRQLQQQQHKVVKSVRTRRLSPDEMSSLLRASPDNLVAPTFLHTLNEVHVKPGELARLDARLIGSHPIDVRWLKDGQRVRADKQHKLLLEGDLYTLLILESAPSDAGFYECLATNQVGEARCGASLRVSQDGRQSASSISGYGLTTQQQQQQLQQQYQVGVGVGQLPVSSSMATSSSSQFSTSTVQMGTQIAAQFNRQQQHLERQQQHQEAPRLHFGVTQLPHHQLMSQYSANSSSSMNNLDDLQQGNQTKQQQQQQQLIPKLIKGLESQLVREGKSVTLRCQISAHPKAEIFWFKHGDKPIKPSKYFRIFKDNDETHCLKILETFAEDQGEYRCVARAQNGQLETSATITVVPSSPR